MASRPLPDPNLLAVCVVGGGDGRVKGHRCRAPSQLGCSWYMMELSIGERTRGLCEAAVAAGVVVLLYAEGA